MKFAGKLIELENIVLSEVSHTQKDKPWVFSYLNLGLKFLDSSV